MFKEIIRGLIVYQNDLPKRFAETICQNDLVNNLAFIYEQVNKKFNYCGEKF